MSPTSLVDRAATRSYGLLASRVSGILDRLLTEQRPPHDDERPLLEHGLNLLELSAEGSRLAEGKPLKTGSGPSASDIRDLRHSLTTLKLLSNMSADADTAEAFGKLADDLRAVEHVRLPTELDLEGLSRLKEFFLVLSSLLINDLRSEALRSSSPTRLPHLQRPVGRRP